jgi:hypothetical protein
MNSAIPASRNHHFLALVTALLVSMAFPATASAQGAQDAPPGKEPIGRFAADARVSMPGFKEDAAVAAVVGVDATELPGRGFGLAFGAHVYPLRMGVVTLGLGGEVMASRASNTIPAATEGGPDGPTVKTRFSAVSPQVSFNFGSSEGWSYVSGGLGWSRFGVELEQTGTSGGVDAESDPRRKTINYGGGARWFTRKHLAVSIDLRFYAVSPQLATGTKPALPRTRLMVLSFGAAFK